MRNRGLRAILLASCCAVLTATAGTVHGEDPPAPPLPAVPVVVPKPPQAEIDAAVARGVKIVQKEQKRSGQIGQHAGETALALLALRHSGIPAENRHCRRAASFLERDLPDGTVYGAALGVIALLQQDRRLHSSKIDELVGDLVAAQCRNGQWSYGYRRQTPKPSGDNSNMQFALLALASARAHAISVDVKPFRRAREFLAATQNEDGGFGYSDKERSRSYASMTAGGAMMLALCAAAERGVRAPDPEVLEVPEVAHAVGWLAENFDPEQNTGAARAFGNGKASGKKKNKKKRSDAFWRHYWLWSVERVGAATGANRLGGRDWYAEGGRVLLDRQRDDGSWKDPERGLVATCFALLFFGRSTQRVVTPRRDTPVTPSRPK